MEYSIELVSKGSRLFEIGAPAFLEFWNPLIAEKAFILFQKELTLQEEEEWLRKSAKSIDGHKKITLIAWSKERIIGQATAKVGEYQPYEHNMDLGLLVAKDFRRRGVGRALLQKAIEEGKKAFAPRKMFIAYVDGNEPARQLYESLGFKEIGRLQKYYCHYGEYKDDVVMELLGKENIGLDEV
jgi:RimJ/RimL family protein N-acetyltransferase